MDSDNSNRKTFFFHAQNILDAAAGIKTKKSRTEEKQNDPIYLKIRVYSEKKITCTYILYSIGLYTKWSTSSVGQHFIYRINFYLKLIKFALYIILFDFFLLTDYID